MAVGQETVLDEYAFLVSETDSKGIISFANDDFCKIAEFELDELIGQPHNMVRHPDMPKKKHLNLYGIQFKQEKFGLDMLKMLQNLVDTIGYMLLFIHLKVVMVQEVIFLVEGNLHKKRLKRQKNFMLNGIKRRGGNNGK